MKVLALLLAGLSVVLLLHAFHKIQASELSQLRENEIQELKEDIKKRGGHREPCGNTWSCVRRRRRRALGKRVSE